MVWICYHFGFRWLLGRCALHCGKNPNGSARKCCIRISCTRIWPVCPVISTGRTLRSERSVWIRPVSTRLNVRSGKIRRIAERPLPQVLTNAASAKREKRITAKSALRPLAIRFRVISCAAAANGGSEPKLTCAATAAFRISGKPSHLRKAIFWLSFCKRRHLLQS